MGLLDSLFGSDDQNPTQNSPQNPPESPEAAPQIVARLPRPQNADEQAIARYRFMLQTAPPADLEAAHEEAFLHLTPEQRQMALGQMSQVIPADEARDLSAEPQSLARAATRAEIRNPGFMERSFGGANAVGGLGTPGGLMAGSLLASLAAGFVGSASANSFFSHSEHEEAFRSSPDAQTIEGGITNYADSGFDNSASAVSADSDNALGAAANGVVTDGVVTDGVVTDGVAAGKDF